MPRRCACIGKVGGPGKCAVEPPRCNGDSRAFLKTTATAGAVWEGVWDAHRRLRRPMPLSHMVMRAGGRGGPPCGCCCCCCCCLCLASKNLCTRSNSHSMCSTVSSLGTTSASGRAGPPSTARRSSSQSPLCTELTRTARSLRPNVTSARAWGGAQRASNVSGLCWCTAADLGSHSCLSQARKPPARCRVVP
jgi:hypothetical protein